MLSSRGGGAPRPPVTLSCKADPNDCPAGLALPYCWQRMKFRTNRRHICGWEVGPYNVILALFFYWPESGDPFQKSRNMKFHKIQFRLNFCERHRKTIHMAFGISKNGSDFAAWRRVQVAKKRQISKRGSSGDTNSAAPVAHVAQIQASSSPDSSWGRGKKNLAPNDPVAPRYGRLGETDLGEKSHFSDRGRYGIWRCAKTTLSDAAAPRPNRSPTVALRYVLCGFELVSVWS